MNWGIVSYLCSEMFTGIIEKTGLLKRIIREGSNLHFNVASEISGDLKIDQSLSHDGVCLTVTKIENGTHWVTAIEETLNRSTLKFWDTHSLINLERCLKIGDRLDGHWVQGHVDCIGICTKIMDVKGSWECEFEYYSEKEFKTVHKGSIAINGISLTVAESYPGKFKVAVIPYTMEHTNLSGLSVGSSVNLEFDILGKWVKAWMEK